MQSRNEIQRTLMFVSNGCILIKLFENLYYL